jgi:hypothetical protein
MVKIARKRPVAPLLVSLTCACAGPYTMRTPNMSNPAELRHTFPADRNPISEKGKLSQWQSSRSRLDKRLRESGSSHQSRDEGSFTDATACIADSERFLQPRRRLSCAFGQFSTNSTGYGRSSDGTAVSETSPCFIPTTDKSSWSLTAIA